MTENSNNLNAGQNTGDGHEFLPLDFSSEERPAAKKNSSQKPVKLPLAAVVKETDNTSEQSPAPAPAPMKLPLSAVVKEESQAPTPTPVKLPMAAVVKEETQAPIPAPVKLSQPEKAKSLDEVFPEDDDAAVFPETKKSSNPEIDALKKKFDDTPAKEETAAPRNPVLLKRGFPPVPPKPTPRPAKLVQPKTPIVLSGSISPENASPGQILQEVRVQSGMSVAQVEQVTKIKADYISSLERDDYPGLPPMVYVNAYVKNLCSLYNIGTEDMEKMLKNIKKESTPIVSEEIIHHIEEDRQVNPEEGRKVQRLILASGVLAVLFIVILAFSGIKVYKSYKHAKETAKSGQVLPAEAPSASPQTVTSAGFEEKDLEKLIIPQTFSMDELAIPKKRGR